MGDVSNGPKRVTMAEVAAAAQVSVPTISKVLNGRSDVAPETRSRVQAVFDRYGYRPSASPRTRRSGLIDLVFTDLSPWSIEIIQGAEHAALESKHRVAVTLAADPAEVSRWLASLAGSRSDGVILVLTELADEHRERLADLHTPVVIIDPIGQPDPNVPSIGAANWTGGLAATEHLVELGHRRIGTVTGHPYVQVQVHPAAVPCCHGSARDRAEVPEAGHSEVDSRIERGPEVGVHRVEPAQHRRRETSLPQRQALGDARDPEPRRPVLQRRMGGRDAAVPETVRFHHGHHLGLCPGGEEPGVGGDRSQVNGEHCAVRAVGSGSGGGRRGRAHRAT